MIDQTKMMAEIGGFEAEMLLPDDISLLDDYEFEMDYIGNREWYGYLVTPDSHRILVAFYEETAQMIFDKDNASYRKFVDDARRIYPLNSAPTATMTSLLFLAEMSDWYVLEDA